MYGYLPDIVLNASRIMSLVMPGEYDTIPRTVVVQREYITNGVRLPKRIALHVQGARHFSL